MTSSVAASFDEAATGKQRAAVFEFPEEGELRRKWVEFSGSASVEAGAANGVCSMHFLRSSMINLYRE